MLNRIIKRDTKYSNIELGILNVSPVGDSAKVDLNAGESKKLTFEFAKIEPLYWQLHLIFGIYPFFIYLICKKIKFSPSC